MLTRCPHCGATFRVTDAHLNAAHGKVRCGACMEVFNATEHLLKTPEAKRPRKVDFSPTTPDNRKEPVFGDDARQAKSASAAVVAASPLVAAEGLNQAVDALDEELDFILKTSDEPGVAQAATKAAAQPATTSYEQAAREQTAPSAKANGQIAEPETAATNTQYGAEDIADTDIDALSDDNFLISDDGITMEDEGPQGPATIPQGQPVHPAHTVDDVRETVAAYFVAPEQPADELSEDELDAELERVLRDDDIALQDLASSDDEAEDIDAELDSILAGEEYNLDDQLSDIGVASELDDAIDSDEDSELAKIDAELDAILGDDSELDEDSLLEAAPQTSVAKFAAKETGSESESATEAEEEELFQDNPEEDIAEGHYHRGSSLRDDELSDSFKQLMTDGVETDQFSEALVAEEEETESQDESWAEQMLEELREERKPAPPTPAPNQAQPSLSLQDTAPPAIEPMRPKPTMVYDRLRSEPIAVDADDEDEPSSGLLRIIGWTLVNLLLLLALAGQLAWFHYDKLARYDNLRNAYQTFCGWVGCTLPQLQDTNLIKSRNLVVRSHPTNPKALVIDSIIINQANFEQPFPVIAFQFSDINNNVVAKRLFAPKDYLSGEAASLHAMPPQTPVHISLEILDPGAAAVNYTMHFLPAQTATN